MLAAGARQLRYAAFFFWLVSRFRSMAPTMANMNPESTRSRRRCLLAVNLDIDRAIAAFDPISGVGARYRFNRLLFQCIGDIVAAEDRVQGFSKFPSSR
jgi:hypothetical protein